ncbi:MAG TPA: prephenate dehydrogenase/arogenate dehydrogenase family protein [Mycobacteriales bacterium]
MIHDLAPRRVAVLGLGLIGGSLVRRLAAAGVAVTAYDADPGTRAIARTAAGRVGRAAGWSVTSSVAEAVEAAGTVVSAVPLPALGTVLRAVAATGYEGLLTDVTSVKGPAAALAAAHTPRARWVGGHPMAGTEHSGFAFSDPGLFEGAAWVLTLDGQTSVRDWAALAALYTGIGARVVPATAAEHDAAAARISHLPHLVAAALAAGAADGPAGPLALSLAAGSFRDGTRVAATRPELTAAMCGANAAALRAELDALRSRLARMRHQLDAGDPVEALVPSLAAGHAVRAGWPAAPGEPETVPVDAEALLAVGRAGGWVAAVAPDGRSVTVVRPAP